MAAAAGGGKRIAIDVTKLMMSDAFDVQLNGDLMTDLHVLFQGPKDSASPAAALLQRSALRSAARSRRTNSSRVRRPVRGRRLAHPHRLHPAPKREVMQARLPPTGARGAWEAAPSNIPGPG